LACGWRTKLHLPPTRKLEFFSAAAAGRTGWRRRGSSGGQRRKFEADGAVLHSDRSCKPYSIGQIDLKDRLSSDLGIKALLLEADHNDPRSWASELSQNRLGAFMESFG